MYALKQVETEDEWSAFHEIRERVLWEARGRFGAYDRSHPDDRKPGNFPLLLMHDGRAVGVLRVDIQSDVAWFRRVAVREDCQRQGHGRKMMRLAMEFARERGCRTVRSNVARAAVGFYKKLGFSEIGGQHTGGDVPMASDL